MSPVVRALITVDHVVCRGSGLCSALSPELFQLDEDGFGVAVENELDGEEDIEMAESVIGCCPTEAVALTILEP